VNTLLRAEGLSAGYGSTPVLRSLSLEVAPGSVVALIGPNGSGKTTLLRVLSGVLRPTSGRVVLRDRDLAAWPARERARRIACVPQHVEVPVPYAVEELAALGRTPYVRGWTRLADADRRAIDEAIAAMELEALRGKSIDAVSAGERQRALLAMALAQQPEVLLLDEPTAHLDLHHAARLMQRVRALAAERGIAIVLSSHDLALAADSCDRLVLLDRGIIAAHGAPCDVLSAANLSSVYRHRLHAKSEDGHWWVRAE